MARHDEEAAHDFVDRLAERAKALEPRPARRALDELVRDLTQQTIENLSEEIRG